MVPKRPQLPKLPSTPIQPLRDIVRQGRQQIQKAKDDIHSMADELRTTTEEPSTKTETATSSAAKGTACLPCCRDHLSVTSSALSEGIRFARDKGVNDPEALRRIRIALDELNVMERIDLAPDATAKLKGAEKELANWTLKGSRGIRHAITAIRDVESMEQAAAEASAITEEFMKKLWELPQECPECEALEDLASYIKRRKAGEA